MPEKFACRSCLKPVVIDDQQCREATVVSCVHCGARLVIPPNRDTATDAELQDYRRASDRPKSAALGNYPSGVAVSRETGAEAIGALGALAWVILAAHLIVAVLLLADMLRAGAAFPGEFRALVIGAAIGILVEGIFLCVLYRALHWTGKNVISIMENLKERTG